jgi:serine/threonine protein kinase
MDTDVIHGDIKPQNVLVFKDATGTTIKVADFGYSTLAAGDAGKVFLPKSRPWNAPEHHFGEFEALKAKKADVYSYGMLCLWALFGHSLPDIPQTNAEGATTIISFDTPTNSSTSLERLKNDDRVEYIARQLVDSIPLSEITTEHKIHLKEFFSSTVSLNPDKRSSDFRKLAGLLSPEQ